MNLSAGRPFEHRQRHVLEPLLKRFERASQAASATMMSRTAVPASRSQTESGRSGIGARRGFTEAGRVSESCCSAFRTSGASRPGSPRESRRSSPGSPTVPGSRDRLSRPAPISSPPMPPICARLLALPPLPLPLPSAPVPSSPDPVSGLYPFSGDAQFPWKQAELSPSRPPSELKCGALPQDVLSATTTGASTPTSPAAKPSERPLTSLGVLAIT